MIIFKINGVFLALVCCVGISSVSASVSSNVSDKFVTFWWRNMSDYQRFLPHEV
ncbi:MAG: hypothetical protein IJ848_02330 [Alphaproteobacteria bacterium]|nr:hypothetical protein [Alphaproteobacteria bacterium]